MWFLLDLSLTYLIIVMGDACQFSSFPNASVREKVYSFLIFAFIKEFLTLISVYFTPFFLPWFHCARAHFNECLRNAESLCHSPGSLDWGIEVEREISRYRLQGRAPYLLPKYSELTRRYYFTVVKVKMFVNSFKTSKFKSRLCKAPLLTLVFLKSLVFSVSDCLGIFLSLDRALRNLLFKLWHFLRVKIGAPNNYARIIGINLDGSGRTGNLVTSDLNSNIPWFLELTPIQVFLETALFSDDSL